MDFRARLLKYLEVRAIEAGIQSVYAENAANAGTIYDGIGSCSTIRKLWWFFSRIVMIMSRF
jgi:hypothetical protein